MLSASNVHSIIACNDNHHIRREMTEQTPMSGGKRNVNMIYVYKTDGMRPAGRPRPRWDI